MKEDLKIAFMGATFIVMIVILSLFKTELGLDTSVDVDFIELMPSLFGAVIGFVIVGALKGVFCVPGMFVVGLAGAHLATTMNTQGLFTVEILNGLSLAQLNMWILIFCTLIGGGLMVVIPRYD
jgi:hypothetical protein